MYLIVFAAGAISSLFRDKKNRLFFLFAMILLLLAAFRYGVGADYFSYRYLFDRLNVSAVEEIKNGLDDKEVLFTLIGSILKSLGVTYQLYLAIFAAVNLYFVCKICTKHSENPMLSLFLYYAFFYFVWTFSGIRQGISLAIGAYYLIECIEKKKTVKMILITLILSMIHYSSLILLVFYFISRIRLTRKFLIGTSIASIILSMLPLGRLLAPFSGLPLMSKVIPYLSAEYSLSNAFNFPSIARMVFLLVGLIYYNHYIARGETSRIIINLYIIGLNVYFIFKFSELMAARLSIFGFYLVILILPNIFALYKSKFNKTFFVTLLFILISLYFYKEMNAMSATGYKGKSSFIMPYTNIFTIDKERDFVNEYKLY